MSEDTRFTEEEREFFAHLEDLDDDLGDILRARPNGSKTAQTGADLAAGFTAAFREIAPDPVPVSVPVPVSASSVSVEPEEESGTNWLLIGGLLLTVVMVGGVAYYVTRE